MQSPPAAETPVAAPAEAKVEDRSSGKVPKDLVLMDVNGVYNARCLVLKFVS